MIRALTGVVTGGVDLLEAEGRLARVHLVRLGALVAVFMGSALVVGVAVVGVGAGVVVLLAERIGLGPALLWTGAVTALLGIGAAAGAWSSYRSGEEVES